MSRLVQVGLGLLLLAGLLAAAGCLSAGDDSDIPWAEPQPWEHTLPLPGLTPQD